ncbi:unnamed protein product [Closterium sp. NIES-64]|nr:unnamed protein product [Closterium sp. NIES-64]
MTQAQDAASAYAPAAGGDTEVSKSPRRVPVKAGGQREAAAKAMARFNAGMRAAGGDTDVPKSPREATARAMAQAQSAASACAAAAGEAARGGAAAGGDTEVPNPVGSGAHTPAGSAIHTHAGSAAHTPAGSAAHTPAASDDDSSPRPQIPASLGRLGEQQQQQQLGEQGQRRIGGGNQTGLGPGGLPSGVRRRARMARPNLESVQASWVHDDPEDNPEYAGWGATPKEGKAAGAGGSSRRSSSRF